MGSLRESSPLRPRPSSSTPISWRPTRISTSPPWPPLGDSHRRVGPRLLAPQLPSRGDLHGGLGSDAVRARAGGRDGLGRRERGIGAVELDLGSLSCLLPVAHPPGRSRPSDSRRPARYRPPGPEAPVDLSCRQAAHPPPLDGPRARPPPGSARYVCVVGARGGGRAGVQLPGPVSYTHLRAHET